MVFQALDCIACWLLVLEYYRITFEYIPGKESMIIVVDVLSSLESDNLKIQKEEA
jgi:hypothetical protein